MRIILSAIITLSVALTSGATIHYMNPLKVTRDTAIAIPTQNIEADMIAAVETRIALVYSKDETKGNAAYALGWKTAQGDSLSVGVRVVNLSKGLSIDNMALNLECTRTKKDGSSELLFNKALDSKDASVDAANSMAVEFAPGQPVKIFFGRYNLKEIAILPDSFASPSDIRLSVMEPCDIVDLIYEVRQSAAAQLKTDWTKESLTDYFIHNSLSPIEGFWGYLDRATDDRYTRLGGKYQLAVVANNDDGYDIIYLGGAVTGASKWREGMRKGRLKPTVFQNNFDMEWNDATMRSHDDELSAQLTDNSILTFSFPLYESQLRFFRVPMDK